MSLYSDNEDFEYCGDCVVCGDPVDHSEMGACSVCGQVFHWSECGDWGNSGHECDNCKALDGEE